MKMKAIPVIVIAQFGQERSLSNSEPNDQAPGIEQASSIRTSIQSEIFCYSRNGRSLKTSPAEIKSKKTPAGNRQTVLDVGLLRNNSIEPYFKERAVFATYRR